MTHVLVCDNYDSFVYNLVQYLGQLGVGTTVVRNDAVPAGSATALLDDSGADAVLVSPGPGTPEAAGRSVELVTACAERAVPMLGVCLGHQALAVAFGASVDRAPELLHGKTSPVRHDGTGVLAGLPDPFTATRYHSLAAAPTSLPAELVANAWTPSGVVMGIRHATLPLHGVQFHPESVLTEGGHRLLATWLGLAGDAAPAALVAPLEADVETLRTAAFR